MTRGAWRRAVAWADGLAPRLALYLSIALLPLGLIALWQTRASGDEASRRSELTLLALTSQGATGVRQAIERALGAAEAVGVLAPLDDAGCERAMAELADAATYGFAALLRPDGAVACASPGTPPNLAGRLAPLVAEPGLRVTSIDAGDILVLAPIDGPGRAGVLALSIAPGGAAPVAALAPSPAPVRLVTFGADGSVLVAQGGGDVLDALPANRDLAEEARLGARVFPGRDAAGRDQVYSVVPIVPGVAYALGVWPPDREGVAGATLAVPPVLFPLLMWAVGLAVAFWSVHRLVIARVGEIEGRMRRFGRDRALPEPWADRAAPRELRAIDDAFRHTALAILHDEARMQDALRERGVLLKEVHHRVKNNLQLISSIISMQLRRLPEPRARAVLRRLQERVLTLAAIYRALYTGPDMADVNVAPVLRSIAQTELRGHPGPVDVRLDIEDVTLDPDKAVPLVFLAAEALSNARAHLGSADGRPELALGLRREGEAATLTVSNTLAPGAVPPTGAALGLGQHLIGAFAAQVGGPVVVDAAQGRYELSVTFPLLPARDEAA